MVVGAALGNIGDDQEANRQLDTLADSVLQRLKENDRLFSYYSKKEDGSQGRPRLELQGCDAFEAELVSV